MPSFIITILAICIAGASVQAEQTAAFQGQLIDHSGHYLHGRQAIGSIPTTLLSPIVATSSTKASQSITGLSSSTAPTGSSISFASPTTSAQSSSPTPMISFSLKTLQSCSQGLVNWAYNGPSGQKLNLNVTNINVPQPSNDVTFNSSQSTATVQTSRSVGSNNVVNEIIVTNLDPSAQNFTWNPVNVREGWYIVIGIINNDTTTSPMFYVANGSETSCLLPVADSQTGGSRAKLSAGVLAGIVVGGIAILLITILASVLACAHRRRHHSDRQAKPWTTPGSGFRNRFSRQSLGSLKYGLGAGVNGGASTTSKASTGGASRPDGDIDHYKEGVSQEKLFSPRSPLGTHVLASPPTFSPVNQFAERVSMSTRTSQRSTIDYTTSPNAGKASDSVASSPYANTILNNSSTDVDDATPTTPPNPRRDRSLEYPPISPDTRSRRSSARRSRQPRKPVPEYVPSDPAFDSDTYSPSFRDNTISRNASVRSAGQSSTKTGYESLADDATDAIGKRELELQRFGDMKMNKPVHVVIPDMPPPSAWY